jgi:p70 ribosomal S6 kinase
MLLSLRSGAHAPCFMLQLSLPKWLGSETHSILKQLLERNVDKRLGSGKSTMFQVKGVQAIKKHPFFRDIDWYLLAQKQLTPPIVPVVQSNTDTTYFAEEFTAMPVGRRSTLEHGGDDVEAQKLFARFSFIAADAPSFADIVKGSAPAPSSPATVASTESEQEQEGGVALPGDDRVLA